MDPLEGLMFFLKANWGEPQSTKFSGDRVFSRCLVPITSLVVRESGHEVTLHDPNRPLLTMAGLIGGIPRDDSYESGMCFLTSDPAPLVVASEHHEEWLCRWYTLDRVRACAAPMLLSRLNRA